MKIRNPRTGEADYTIAPPSPAELAALAVEARNAQRGWAALMPEQRAAALTALAGALTAESEAIAAALTIDTGRAALSKVEVMAMTGALHRWAARAPALIAREAAASGEAQFPKVTHSIRLIPYPLVGVISPWNFPLILALIDAIPALAAGCAVIIKPSEVTPRFIAPLRRAVSAVPQLRGVLHLIEGDGETGAALIDIVDYICFTGSVATGRRVGEAAARAFIPACLELGGKDPMLVLGDADPVWAASVALRASVVNNGQACQSIERVYVAQSIYPAFVEALTAQAKAVRLNWPDIHSGDIGPFIFERQARIVADQIVDARAHGAAVLTGGEVRNLDGGLYLEPTVLTGVTPDMAVMRDETFGPVIPVVPFDSEDEAVTLANAGDFGLSAAVLSGSVDRAEAVAARLSAGAVSINDGSLTAMVWEAEKSSFGHSGIGASRMGDSGLLRFFRRQALLRQTGPAAPIAAYAEDSGG